MSTSSVLTLNVFVTHKPTSFPTLGLNLALTHKADDMDVDGTSSIEMPTSSSSTGPFFDQTELWTDLDASVRPSFVAHIGTILKDRNIALDALSDFEAPRGPFDSMGSLT